MTENMKRLLGVTVFIILIVALMPAIVDTVNTAYNNISAGGSISIGAEIFGDDFDNEDFAAGWSDTGDWVLTEDDQYNGNASATPDPEERRALALYIFDSPVNDIVVEAHCKLTDPEGGDIMDIMLTFGESTVVLITNDYDDGLSYAIADELDFPPIYYDTDVAVSTDDWDNITIYYSATLESFSVTINGDNFEYDLRSYPQIDNAEASGTLAEPLIVNLDCFHIYAGVITGGVADLTGGSGFLALLLLIPFVWIVAVAYYIIRKQIYNESI